LVSNPQSNTKWQDVYYDPTSPSGLRWASDRRAGRDYRILKMSKDSVAGCKQERYYFVRIGGRLYLAHVVVWELHNGTKPSWMTIDHEDGDSFNNKIENLVLKTRAANLRNRSKPVNNSSGVTGVNVHRRNGVPVAYRAQWKDDDGAHMESFSVAKYGEDLARHMAISRRQSAITTLNANGAGYTDRHGT